MGKLVHLLGAVILMPLPLSAQSAASFSPPAQEKPTAMQEGTPAAAKPSGSDPAQATNRPSRYVGANVDAYVAALSKVFAIRSRSADPFGQLQDPAAKPVKPKIVQSSVTRAAVIPNTSYAEIVSQIRVTTVIPAEGRFLVGTRSFSKGDRFPIAFRGKSYQTQVAEVTSSQIVFRNVENSETGVLKLDMMPPGMSRGANGRITTPGMQPARADAPLEIEGGPPPQASGLN